jgi:uncharacterized damage-inducible protein DinB
MKRALQFLVLGVFCMAAVMSGRAQQMKGFRADLIGQMEYAQKEILDLENAIPDEKMTWRPNDEVRSISEVYSHIAFGNYLFCKFAGAKVPEGIAMSSPDDEKKWDKMSADKKVIREQLVTSFDFAKKFISAMPDAGLENMVDFFGNKMNVRSLLMAYLGHMHEHLGQSIAYARMEGIVPPWTAAQMEAAKAKK